MQVLYRLPADSWPVVMGCGIVSIDLDAVGQQVLSQALLWFAVAVLAPGPGSPSR